MKGRQRTSHKDAGNSRDTEKNPSKNAKSDHDELLHTSIGLTCISLILLLCLNQTQIPGTVKIPKLKYQAQICQC